MFIYNIKINNNENIVLIIKPLYFLLKRFKKLINTYKRKYIVKNIMAIILIPVSIPVKLSKLLINKILLTK